MSPKDPIYPVDDEEREHMIKEEREERMIEDLEAYADFGNPKDPVDPGDGHGGCDCPKDDDTGSIYVLKSLSLDESISSINDLYKIY